MNWGAVSAFATWVLAGSIFLAFWQIRECKRSTNAQVAKDLFRELRNYETVDKIRSIYELKIEGPNKPDFGENTTKHIDYVLEGFNILGALVAKGIIDKQLAIETYTGHASLRCCYKLCKHYIRRAQRRRGYYQEKFETFERLSLDYFKEHQLKAKFYWSEEDDIDLLDKLQDDNLRPGSLEEIIKDRIYEAKDEKQAVREAIKKNS